jgi:DNA-binding MarR family transcriptional regulator
MSIEPAVISCVCANLRMASRAVTRVYDDALRPAGLRTTQYSVLARLRDEGPSTQTRLADRLVIERSTLARELRTLEAAGLVDIAQGRDRRQRIVELSTAGVEALEVADPLWRDVQARVRDGLGRERTGLLLDELRALVAARL